MSWGIGGAIDAWRNASLDSVKYDMEIDIGDKSNWLLPAIFPRVGKFLNNWVSRPLKTLGGMVFGANAKEAPEAPEVPETFKGTALEKDLKTAYEQKCAAVDAKAKKWHCYASLDFAGARQEEAVAEHNRALDRVARPENYETTAGVSAAKGTLVGGLAADDSGALKGLAVAAVDAMTGKNVLPSLQQAAISDIPVAYPTPTSAAKVPAEAVITS